MATITITLVNNNNNSNNNKKGIQIPSIKNEKQFQSIFQKFETSIKR